MMQDLSADEDEEALTSSQNITRENSAVSSDKKKKGHKKKRSTVVKHKKNSVATADTKNFLQDIDSILDNKDEAVLQNPKSSRMTLSIKRNVNQESLLNRPLDSSTGGPPRGLKRHTVMKPSTVTKPDSIIAVEKFPPPSPANNSIPSTFRENNKNLTDDEDELDDDSYEDDGPSAFALAMRDKFRQERIKNEKDQEYGNKPDPLQERRTIARERLKTTVQNLKAKDHSSNNVSPLPNNSLKRISVAKINSEKKRFSVARHSNNSPGLPSASKPPSSSFDIDQSESSSGGDSDESNSDDWSSESESESYSDYDEGSSENFDINDVGVETPSEESSVTVYDPKFEASKADPLLYDMLMMGDGGVGKTALLERFILDSFSKDYETTRGINRHSSTIYVGQKKMLDRGKLKKQHVHVKLNIWDIGGRLKKYDYIKDSYILNSIIVFVVYDVTSLDSYMNALDTIRHVREVKYDQMIVLVGNKADSSTIAADDDDYDSDEDIDNIVVVVPPPPTGLRRLSMIGNRRNSQMGRQQVRPAPIREINDSNSDDSDGGPRQVLREIAKREAAVEALKVGALFFETSAKTGHNVYVMFNEVAKILVHKRRKLLFRIEAGIKKAREENGEHSSDFESDSSSDSEKENDDADENGEDGKVNSEKSKKKDVDDDDNSSDDSVLSAMTDWSDEVDDSDDDYVDIYGWGGGKRSEKADCSVM